MYKKPNSVLNGFGRFGNRFLNYYLKHFENRHFELKQINDENLSVEKMQDLFLTDSNLDYKQNWSVSVKNDVLKFIGKLGEIHILFSNLPVHSLPEDFQFFFECSGKYTDITKFPKNFCYKKVFISATSYNSDQTLIYGYNEKDYKQSSKYLSYGSCTVNAFVPLANALNEWKILESDVSVIHSVPEYILEKNKSILEKRNCTLTTMAPKLLQFLNNDNFLVDYTLAPFLGPSIINFRFKLQKKWELQEIFDTILQIKSNDNKKLYTVLGEDRGNHSALLSEYSAEIIKNNSRKVGENLYLGAYFDNENSVNRYFDLINYVTRANK